MVQKKYKIFAMKFSSLYHSWISFSRIVLQTFQDIAQTAITFGRLIVWLPCSKGPINTCSVESAGISTLVVLVGVNNCNKHGVFFSPTYNEFRDVGMYGGYITCQFDKTLATNFTTRTSLKQVYFQRSLNFQQYANIIMTAVQGQKCIVDGLAIIHLEYIILQQKP